MSYKPTVAKYVGPTKTLFITYDQTWTHTYRGKKKKKRTQTRVKKVYISGKKIKASRVGTHTNRKGRKIHGIKFTYETGVKKFTAKRGKTKFKQPRKKITVQKVVAIPKTARKVKVRRKLPKKLKGPLMAVA